jgi:hypothetical protein
MEEKKASIGVITLGYGALLGVALIIYGLLMYVLDLQQNRTLSYLSFVILLAGIFLAQLNYRKKYMGGFLPYSQAFLVGLLTALFASILVGIYTFIFFKYIDPNAMAEAKQLAEEGMIKRGMTDQQVDQAMTMMERFQTAGWYTTWAVIANIFIGAILSLITAIFVKKENMNQGMPA